MKGPAVAMAVAGVVIVVMGVCCTLLAGPAVATSPVTDATATQPRSEQPKHQMVTKNMPDKVKEEIEQAKLKIQMMVKERTKKYDRLGKITRRPHSEYLSSYEGVTKNEPISSYSFISAYQDAFNDPEWHHQWYVQDYRVDDSPVVGLNVMPLYWKGITGRGITVAVVDDGIDSSNEDISPNYQEYLSYQVCWMKQGAPHNPAEKSSHGTKSAGVIAMAANNNICGVGVAFETNIAGINYACHPWATDYSYSRAALHKLQSFEIYSNSWGPRDDGQHMGTIKPLHNKALHKGIKEGRGGKGAIYVWAAGNGGKFGDNCAADEIVNHISSIAIGCASQRGQIIPYGESCSAIYATTYSANDNGKDEMIVAPDISMGNCVNWYGGTSAAAPLASGIFALLLQANDRLTYRDLMHLIALGSEVAPLADNGDIWYRNAIGFWVSLWFGFGLLNAENMYLLAIKWQKLPAKHTCKMIFYNEFHNLPWDITFMKTEVIDFQVDACSGTDKEVLYLEQLELSPTIKYPYRGALHIDLVSPSGTRTTIFAPRPMDKNTDGLVRGNSFKSLHTWGEDPRGIWKLEVTPKMRPGGWRATFGSVGMVQDIRMTLHGTKKKPFYYNSLVRPPRKYWGFRLPDGRTSEDPFPPIPDRY